MNIMDNSIIGKTIDGRYEILSLIGVGGMSNVYKAVDNSTGNIVAVKFLKQEFFENEELVRRFKNESKAISLLDNPNIIKVIDVNIDEEKKYIVVEYIDGITLKEYIENRKVLTWQETVRFTSVILSAIGHAHENGIIHRDLKPQNIMLLRDGTLKIMDFGIARLSTAGQKTVTDKAIGSVHYISPEQVRGKNSDGRSDIYSIGIMMYEMLTGKLPFVSETAVSVAMKQVSDTATPPSRLVSSIPKGLEQIVLHAIEKNANDRYQNTREMLEDLKKFKQNPAIEFNYDIDREKTQAVKVENLAQKKNSKKVNIKKGVHLTLPIMAGVAAAFAVSSIIACFLIFKLSGNPLLTKRKDIELPNFVGMTEDEVKNSSYKLKYDITYIYSAEHRRGVVCTQNPRPPKTIKENGIVKLTVSQGVQTIQMPDLINSSRSDAEKALSDIDVNISITTVQDKNVKLGHVVKTEPERGSIITTGSTVTLFISAGDGEEHKVQVDVPNVVGAPNIDETRKILANNNLRVGTYTQRNDSAPVGTIIEQIPAAGEKMTAGGGVTLVISRGLPTCPVCGSTDHTSHPTCSICGSTGHLRPDHACELCGEIGHGSGTCPLRCPVHGGAHKDGECPETSRPIIPPIGGDGSSAGGGDSTPPSGGDSSTPTGGSVVPPISG